MTEMKMKVVERKKRMRNHGSECHLGEELVIAEVFMALVISSFL